MTVFLKSSPAPSRPWRIALAGFAGLVAVLILVFSVQSALPGIRDLAQWWMLMVALALTLFSVFVLWDLTLSGLMLLLLFVGGASQLYVTQPLWYPALRLPPRTTIEMAMYAIIFGQGALSAFVLFRNSSDSKLSQVISDLGVKRTALFLLLSGAFTIPILDHLRQNEIDVYFIQLAAGLILVVINLVTVIALAATLPRGVTLPAGWRWAGYMATVFLIATLVLEWLAFERVPHVQDELAYMFQAKTYASGALYVPAMPEGPREAFEHYLLDHHNGRWISVFTPGWPAFLAVGVLFGAPWLVNPILGTASIFLAQGVMQRLTNMRTASISTLILATSPWFIAMSATLMAHTFALFLLLLAWLLILRAEEGGLKGAILSVFVAGLALGWLFLTRNLDGLLLGVLTGLFLLWRGGVLRHPLTVLSYSAGCVATGSLIFFYNYYFTGDPLLTTLSDYYHRTWIDGSNAFGFGQNIGSPEGWGDMELRPHEHSLFEGLINTLTTISALHTDFMGWGVGSLVFVWVLLIYGRTNETDRMMLAIIFVVAAAHTLYWFVSIFYVGPRYWFMMIIPLAFLNARGFLESGNRLKSVGLASAPGKLNVVLLVLCLFSVTVFLSYRGVTRYHDHRAYNDHYRYLVLPETEGTAQPLVFITPKGQPASAQFFNDPWFPLDEPVFAKDLGDTVNDAVIKAFPGRAVLYYDEQQETFYRK
ncbi:glycosyltransferase family 39 protein [Ruegeria arenilitoris]|uniref:glycosyltransferase family 39 protein n=1 Tax=Ruegeria arenilitoris TaxID=1173585 RepID=UPI001481A7BE|nr:glycosyltransferase family 39 protein [Ruegeria arenilitoris]